MDNPLILALIGTGCSFAGTILGSAMVFLVRGKTVNVKLNKIFLGFASGVMIAASIWSLLLPSLAMAEEQGVLKWMPALVGFLGGGVFLFILDKLLPHLHFGSVKPEGMRSSWKRSTMLVFAVTLHNIPEGMAVGLTFALASQAVGGGSTVTFAGAMALALGMALQNFPEGAAISLPLQNEGFKKGKSFFWGAMSGIVEPIAGIIGVLLAITVAPVMPYMLAFAAGAMIYVVVDELIPQAYTEHSNIGTLAALVGFAVMMLLDISLS